MNYAKEISNEDFKFARKVESAGLATISTATKTIYRAKKEGDTIAIKTVSEWETKVK